MSELTVVLAAGMVALRMAMSFVRRAVDDERPFLFLCAIDLAALVYLRAARREGSLAAVVAVVVAAVLTIGARLLDRWESNAVGRDDLGGARRFALLRELVVPGRGSAHHRRAIENLIELKQHGSQALARRLLDGLARARDAKEGEQLHEELIVILVLDRRFAEAVEHFERHLGERYLAQRPALLPQLGRAYTQLGQLARACALLDAVENGPVGGDPSVVPIVARARLVVLACAGAVAQLGRLLVDGAGAWVHPREREILLGLARAHARTPRSPEDEALIEQLAARTDAGRQLQTRRPSPVTWALIALNLCAFAASNLLAGSDETGLIRAGALFRPAVLGGEWWRALTAMFLHANLLHLGLNMYALFLLGGMAEEMCGAWRYIIIYVVGGLVGAAASTAAGVGALSVGASGAIMGLLGALIVILFLRKKRGKALDGWRRAMLWNLILLGALQVCIGFVYPMIDNAAHVGGMLGGAAAALVFAPGLLIGDGKIARAVVGVVAALALALLIAAGVLVGRTSLPETLARLPTRRVRVSAVEIEVPRHWELDEAHARFEDPYLGLELTVGERGEITSSRDDEPAYRELLDRVRRSARALP